MLRIVVIGLVVANLLLLGLQASKPTAPEEVPSKPVEINDSNVPTIHLFSELMQDDDLMSVHRRCYSLGPFRSTGELAKVRTRLLEVSTQVRERETQALIDRGYWLYMPPYKSAAEAMQALALLRALGQEDIAVIYNGEWTNALSLGYFSQRINAQKRIDELEGKGYSPQMEVRHDSEPRYWLDYEQDAGAKLIELDMQNQPPDFMQRPLPCLQDQ